MKKSFFFYLYFVCCCWQANALEAQEKTLLQEEQLVSPAQTFSATLQPSMEIDIFNKINQNRVANFLPSLAWSEVVAAQARTHSLNMANKIVPFSHQGVEARFTALTQAIPSLSRFGENVAYNFGYPNPVATAVSGWLKSPGHYANIMGDFNLTGVGVARNPKGEYYFTQIFIKATETAAVQAHEMHQLRHPQACKSVCEAPILIE